GLGRGEQLLPDGLTHLGLTGEGNERLERGDAGNAAVLAPTVAAVHADAAAEAEEAPRPAVVEPQIELRGPAFSLAPLVRGLIAQLGADRSPTYHGRGLHGSSASCDTGGGPPE